MNNKPTILTIILKDEARKYEISKEKADRLLEVLKQHYPIQDEDEKDKDRLISIIKEAKNLLYKIDGNNITIYFR